MVTCGIDTGSKTIKVVIMEDNKLLAYEAPKVITHTDAEILEKQRKADARGKRKELEGRKDLGPTHRPPDPSF